MKKEKALAREIRFLGLTQKSLSEKLGIHENTITNWIKGAAVISPVLYAKLKEIGIPVKALKNPSKEV